MVIGKFRTSDLSRHCGMLYQLLKLRWFCRWRADKSAHVKAGLKRRLSPTKTTTKRLQLTFGLATKWFHEKKIIVLCSQVRRFFDGFRDDLQNNNNAWNGRIVTCKVDRKKIEGAKTLTPSERSRFSSFVRSFVCSWNNFVCIQTLQFKFFGVPKWIMCV